MISGYIGIISSRLASTRQSSVKIKDTTLRVYGAFDLEQGCCEDFILIFSVTLIAESPRVAIA